MQKVLKNWKLWFEYPDDIFEIYVFLLFAKFDVILGEKEDVESKPYKLKRNRKVCETLTKLPYSNLWYVKIYVNIKIIPSKIRYDQSLTFAGWWTSS